MVVIEVQVMVMVQQRPFHDTGARLVWHHATSEAFSHETSPLCEPHKTASRFTVHAHHAHSLKRQTPLGYFEAVVFC